MSCPYPTYVTQISNIMVVASSDPGFTTFLPGAIDYAEGRLYRDLDLISVTVTDTSVSTSSGVRSVNLSTAQGYMLIVERVNILTAGNTQRQQLYPVSPEYLDAVYGGTGSSNCGMPIVFSRPNDTNILFGPPPDATYTVETIGSIRPTPLSSGNSSTWLTQNVPELMIAATMVFAAGYMRDFGAQSDNPQMAQSWEQQYQALLKSANVDEQRKKYASQGWFHEQPATIATPPRV